MDLYTCLGVSLVETVALGASGHPFLKRMTPLQTFWTVFVLQYATAKLYRFFIQPFFLSPFRYLPGPKNNHFLLGQEVNKFRAASPNDLYLSWMRRWPDAPLIRYFSFGNSEVLLVNSLAAHKEVLQTKCYSFVKPPFFGRLVGEIVGKGLLFSEGDEHRRQRKLLAGPFSLPNLKNLLPVFQSEAQHLAGVIEKIIGDGKSNVVEVSSVYSKATLSIIGVSALGMELQNPMVATTFHECYHQIFDQSLLGGLITAVNSFIPIRHLLPIEANRGFVRANGEIRRLIRDLIQQRIKEVAETKVGTSGRKSRDLLTYMIEERLTGDDAWTEDDILGHLLNFVAAGHETTAGALTWATYVLSTRPDVQAKLRAEIVGVVQGNVSPSYTDIEALRYLNNFCREVLRVYSPAIMAPREAGDDITIAGVPIPKGTSIMMCPAVMHFHPNVWGPDASAFDPDRWDRLAGDAASPFALETFIQGPRMCIGRAFAMLELKSLLVELIRHLVFRAIESGEKGAVVVDNPSLTLKPKGGLKVIVERA